MMYEEAETGYMNVFVKANQHVHTMAACVCLGVCICGCRVTVLNAEVRWDSGDSPDQPQREREPADVMGTEQVTDVMGLSPLRLRFILWGGRACGTSNT